MNNRVLSALCIITFLLVCVNGDSKPAPSASTASSQSASLNGFFLELENALTRELKACAKDSANADSIAISFLDTLSEFGNRFYDIYCSSDTLQKENISGNSKVMGLYGLKATFIHGEYVFKEDPGFVFEKFGKFLSWSGKEFFKTRIRDQLQSCLYDDFLIFLPWDTLGERLQMWDRFCSANLNTYAGSAGKQYLARYLGIFLPCYSIYQMTGFEHEMIFTDQAMQKSHLNYISKYKGSRTAETISGHYAVRNSKRSMNTADVDSFMKSHDIPPSIFHYNPKDLKSAIMYTSCYNRNEIKPEYQSRKWMILVDSSKSWELHSASPVFKKGYDFLEEESTLVCISVGRKTGFLLSSGNLSPGPVVSLSKGEPALPQRDSSLVLMLKGKCYRMISRTMRKSEFVFLGRNGNNRFLYYPFRDFDANASLIWLGDLDRDGKMDIILNASDHYNISIVRLFLSGKAKPGELFRWEAHQRSGA